MSKKVLFVATVRSHIGQFHIPFINELKKIGYTVDAAYKDNSDLKKGLDLTAINNVFEVPFSRSPYSFSNIKAYFVLKKIINTNNYDAIHCHTPMGAVITRLAARKARKKGTKVIYTAHGFHFFKGSSKFNWAIFYNIEKILARYTDCLITINQEDYKTVIKNNFKIKKIYKVNGVGVDLTKFKQINYDEKKQLREEYGYSTNDFIMIYPADFSYRKNQEQIINALFELRKKHSNAILLLPGENHNMKGAVDLINKLQLTDSVKILGYRRDIYSLVGLSDISVSTSRQEGLPINLIEAMAVGNGIVATNVRGNNDIVVNGKNGFLVPLGDIHATVCAIEKIMEDKSLCDKFAVANKELVGKYSIEAVNKEMINIYHELCL